MGSPHGRVAIVTGGTKGIGLSTAKLLSKEGYSVVVTYASSTPPDSLLEELGGASRALILKSDGGDVESIDAVVVQTLEKFGQIDVVVPNAGILPMVELKDITEENYDQCMGLNVKGPLFLVQKCAPYLKSGAKVIFISTSLCGSSSVAPNYLLYLTSKGAIEQMTRLVSKDLARRGVAVNAIAPGPTATDMFLRGKPEALVKAVSSSIPSNRLGKPEEIASTIAFLASEAAGWISGQIIRVNGGMV